MECNCGYIGKMRRGSLYLKCPKCGRKYMNPDRFDIENDGVMRYTEEDGTETKVKHRILSYKDRIERARKAKENVGGGEDGN